MKKTLLFFAIVCIAFYSTAATITWGLNAMSYFGSSAIGSGNATGYLVYLGEITHEGTPGWTDAIITDVIQKGNSSAYVGLNGQKTDATSKITGVPANGHADLTTPWTMGTSVYGLIVITSKQTTDAISSEPWYWTGGFFYVDDTQPNPPYNSNMDAYNWTTVIAKGSATNITNASVKDQGWIQYVPIPEPATAGLALAGLALLFRRKRK